MQVSGLNALQSSTDHMGDDNTMANLCCENDKDRRIGTMAAVLKCVARLAFAGDHVQPEHLGQEVWLHSVAIPEICACASPRLPAFSYGKVLV